VWESTTEESPAVLVNLGACPDCDLAIKPNEITAERQGQYSDGTWDYSVMFVFDYATITVAVEYGGEIDDDEDETVPDDVAESAARILADHYGIIVAVES